MDCLQNGLSRQALGTVGKTTQRRRDREMRQIGAESEAKAKAKAERIADGPGRVVEKGPDHGPA